MDVIRHDRTRVYRNHATADVISEPNGNRPCLASVKYHRLARKRRAHHIALSGVESTTGDRLPCVGFRCGTEARQFICADKRRPGAALIVGQSEAVRAEDEVVGQDHGNTVYQEAPLRGSR